MPRYIGPLRRRSTIPLFRIMMMLDCLLFAAPSTFSAAAIKLDRSPVNLWLALGVAATVLSWLRARRYHSRGTVLVLIFPALGFAIATGLLVVTSINAVALAITSAIAGMLALAASLVITRWIKHHEPVFLAAKLISFDKRWPPRPN